MFCFNGSLCRTRCEFGIAIKGLNKFKNSIEKCKNLGIRYFAVRKEWVNHFKGLEEGAGTIFYSNGNRLEAEFMKVTNNSLFSNYKLAKVSAK